ncbi:hypothetical protein KNZ01_19630 [Streptococcus dysgalactiae subsp. equisimilis]|nr:hypothetical protein KNZ01_19630 [Streptococcus dysgalactiae subsp. equisimilis]
MLLAKMNKYINFKKPVFNNAILNNSTSGYIAFVVKKNVNITPLNPSTEIALLSELFIHTLILSNVFSENS